MSTGLISTQGEKENSESTGNVKKMSLTTGMNDRKSLKTLQLSSDGRLLGLEKSMHKNRIVPSKKPVKIFLDASTPKTAKTYKKIEIGIQVGIDKQESETQTDVSGTTGVSTLNVRESHNDSGVGVTDVDQEAYDLMVKDPIPESYWRELAEERRLSLAEALSENEMLHQSMEELKEENNNLSLLAGQAEHLASVLNDVLGEAEDEEENSEDDTNDTGDNSKDGNTETNNETDKEEETKSTEPEANQDESC